MFNNLVDLHTHSLFSNHALSSVTENVDYSLQIGLKVLGLSDHQPDKDGHGASAANFGGLKTLPKYYNGLTILKGIELNAGPNFKESLKKYDKKFLYLLDYAIASFHTYDYLSKSQEQNEAYYLEAIHTALVKILGHIDDGHYPIDYYKIINEAKKGEVLIEINNSSVLELTPRLNALENTKKIISICKELNCPVILNSDAHVKYRIGYVDDAYQLCKQIGLADDLIVNTNLDLFEKYFNIKNIDRRGK